MPTRTGAEPRLAAAMAAAAVLTKGTALDEALTQPLGRLSVAQDRALARRLANDLMRDWPAVKFVLGQLLKRRPARRDALVEFILAIGLLELRQAREPDHAAVHAAVEATRAGKLGHLKGLVNAVLRGYQRRRTEIDKGIPDDTEHRFGYPSWLIQRIVSDWPELWQEILLAGNASPPLWLRVNRRYWTTERARAALQEDGLDSRVVDGLPDALVLKQRVAVSKLPGFAEGGFSIQDGAAQATVEHLHLAPGQRVLDACAAPGGKSAHMLEREEIDLTAVDISADRLVAVEENFRRLGLHAKTLVADVSQPEAWWDGQAFDRILIDAPCSATGVIRRHPDIRWLRRERDLDELTRVQSRLLDRLWPLLKPGGILVYATCSILKSENDEQAQHFLTQHADARILQRTDQPGNIRQILPGQNDMDGFYHLAVERLSGGS
ncbi:MAG: 16S rRNA (cytosine(967)-C(5))-methyltransferase RsmB [Wenzhouxiangella sp.]|nr:16S rRNA (cytosine(967)-C(5))-methyltransferase RsmB [Wenzhouxiangella sp.]